ncbi:helix-turn-helix domain-containing protein [Paenibacillus sp. FSL W8-0426]|uniref:helix-turn-helix domain-containing protein n=1 Tax=Paenibacillus sp. FSL W8-0426 TaxID=2921714 RepID=UPI0030D8A845
MNDYERKVLRILYNYSNVRRRFPTLQELVVKTGRSKADIIVALDGLVDANYILWRDKPDTSTIVILEGWEREADQPKTAPVKQKPPVDTSYWTEY